MRSYACAVWCSKGGGAKGRERAAQSPREKAKKTTTPGAEAMPRVWLPDQVNRTGREQCVVSTAKKKQVSPKRRDACRSIGVN